MIAIIWTFIAGPIGRWIVISLASVAFMAWIRADARGPYVAQVDELKATIIKRDRDAAADRALAELNAAKAEELGHALDKIISTAAVGGTRLTATELSSLQQLARSGGRKP